MGEVPVGHWSWDDARDGADRSDQRQGHRRLWRTQLKDYTGEGHLKTIGERARGARLMASGCILKGGRKQDVLADDRGNSADHQRRLRTSDGVVHRVNHPCVTVVG